MPFKITNALWGSIVSAIESTSASVESVSEKQERRLFLFIAVVLFPLLSIVLVGGFGLLIWISQLIFGPPTA
ncbi:MAG: periplasmic nitrate reductase, NapE protein [Agarilytica sp.]